MAPTSILDLTSYEAIVGLVNSIFSGKNEANGYLERAEKVITQNKLRIDPKDEMTAVCIGSKDETYKVNLQITNVQDGKKQWKCACPAMREKPNAICKHCIAFLLHRINYIPPLKPATSKKLPKPEQQQARTVVQQQPHQQLPPPAAAGTSKRRLPSSFRSPTPPNNISKTNSNSNTTKKSSQKRKINQQTDTHRATTKPNVTYKRIAATKMLAITDEDLVASCQAEVDKVKESIVDNQQQHQQHPPPPPPAAPLFSFDAIFKKSTTTTSTSAPVAPSILASIQPSVSNQTLQQNGNANNNDNSKPIPPQGGGQEEGEDSKPKSLREKMALISGKP